MNAAQLLDRVFDIYTRTFWKQLAYAAIVGVIAMMAVGALSVVLGVAIVAAAAVFFEDAYAMGFFTLLLLVGAIVPAVLVWQAASATGAILLSREAFMGRYIRLPMEQIARVVGRAFTALLAQALVAVPFLAAAGTLIYGFVRFAPYVGLFYTGRAFYVWLIILLAAAAAGFFVFMHVFSLAIAVAVNEKAVFFRALRRSAELIRGDFWRLFGVRVVWVVMIFILVGSAQGILTMLPVLTGTLAAGTPLAMPLLLLLNLVASVGSIVITFAMNPLDGILTAVLYFNQRVKKEGFDLEIAVEGLYRAVW